MKLRRKMRWFALLGVALAGVIAVANRTEAASKKIAKALNEAAIEEYGQFDGPGFLLLSLTQTFEIPYVDNWNQFKNEAEDSGSPVWVIRNGVVVGADLVEEVRWFGDDPINVVGDFADALQSGNATTFWGSYREPSTFHAHVVTPTEDSLNPIPDDVQEAITNASRMFDDALMAGSMDPTATVREGALRIPTTTGALAAFIKLYGGEGGTESSVDVNDILQYGFKPDMFLSCNSPCVAEGDLFNHDPSPEIFSYLSRIDTKNGKATLQLFLSRAGVADFKPFNDNNVINLAANGVEPIALLTETVVVDGETVKVFDPVNELDRSTIVVAVYDDDGFPLDEQSIDPNKISVGQYSDDDFYDLLLHFSTSRLAEVIEVEQFVTINILGYTTEGNMPVKYTVRAKAVPPK